MTDLYRRLEEGISVGIGQGCWVWRTLTNGGYGAISVDGTQYTVHRVTWELGYGPVPTGKELDHLCRNRACCNPAHLELVTRKENLRRGKVGFFLGRCKSGRHRVDVPGSFLEGASDGRTRRICRLCANERARRYKRNRRVTK